MQIQILYFLIPAMTLIFAAVFGALWWQDRTRRYILLFAFWAFTVGLSVCLQTWVFGSIGKGELVFLHLLSSLSIIALVWGVALRYGDRTPLLAFGILSLLTAGILWLARGYGVQPVIIMAQNFNGALILGAAGLSLWLSGRRQAEDKLMMAALVIGTLYGTFRPSLSVILSSTMTMEQYQSSSLLMINIALTSVLCLVLSLSLIALVFTDRMRATKEEGALDPLTGLLNRRAFETQIKSLRGKCQRENLQISVIIADIDYFKQVNDRWGHAVGDLTLKQFAKLIEQQVRPLDIVGRFGGEEFCVLVAGCDEARALEIAERMRLATRGLNVSRREGKRIELSASFGVAQWSDSESYHQVFVRADAALYKAKENGRDQVHGATLGALFSRADNVVAIPSLRS